MDALGEEEEEQLPINLKESRYIELEAFMATENNKILSFNAQSMNNKFQKIRDATQKIKPICLAIQETWGEKSVN